MKAADALGLLAGLGALGALRGGREGTGKRFTGLLDMLDGGGAGASGDRFEGGGLLSVLGNLFAKPLEAQDNIERIAADANATKALTDAIKPRQRTFPQSNQFMPEMPIPENQVVSPMSQSSTPEMPVSPSGVMPPMPQNMTASGQKPIRPMPEALPANLAMPISSSNLFPPASQEFGPNIQQPEGMMMSKQQFVNFILPKYREEYGRNPTQQQMDMAYNTYMSNMGIANNSTNDDNNPPVNQGSALSLEDLRELKAERRRLGVNDPHVITSIAAEDPFNPMTQYPTEKFGDLDLMQIAAMLQRGGNRDGLIANFGADAVREAESMLSDQSYLSIGQLPLGMGGQFGSLSKRELRQRPIKSYRDPSQSTYNTGLLQ